MIYLHNVSFENIIIKNKDNMKTIKILLASLMFVPAALWAQNLKVANTTIDCGQVAYQSPTTADFEITNKSGKSVVIKNVKNILIFPRIALTLPQ